MPETCIASGWPDISLQCFFSGAEPNDAAGDVHRCQRYHENVTRARMTDVNAAVKKATVACPFCAKLNRVRMDRVQDRPKCGECARPLLLDRPIPVTDAAFDKVING